MADQGRMLGLAETIRQYSLKCEGESYTDTGTAWELLEAARQLLTDEALNRSLYTWSEIEMQAVERAFGIAHAMWTWNLNATQSTDAERELARLQIHALDDAWRKVVLSRSG